MERRILRIVTRLNRGGPLRQLEALVPALRERGFAGPCLAGMCEPHEPDGGPDLAAAGADVRRVAALRRGLEPAADGRALQHLLSAIRRFRPHLVHTHMAKAGALGRVAARVAGVPAVHTFHGHHLQAPWPRDRLARFVERRLGGITAMAICLTPRQRRDLVEIHRVLPPERVRVIGPGVDAEALRREATDGSAERLRRRLAGDGRPLFVWAGRFVPVKDPLLLVGAVARSERRFRLLMLGEGPLRPAVLRAVAEEGLQDVVRCPGPVAHVAPWIAAADAVVLASRSEGAPILVVEAKVLGRPALVPAVGGVPDLVRHGVDGWWVPPGDRRALAQALDLLAADGDLRRRLGREAQRDAEARFGRERMADETAALYEEVLRARSGRAG